MSNGTLSRTVRKNKEWVVFELPNGQAFRILVKSHVSKNPQLVGLVIKCPKDIKIKREDNENFGNVKS